MPTSWTTHPQAPPTKTTSNPISKHTNTPTNEAIEGQQDGVQDEKGEGEAEEKRKQTSHKKVVNFFITNFPVSSCKTSLHDLFAECGEILDVYFARKLSKVGKRFGFARFSHVGDVQGLENQLNGITIGRFKLIAHIAKFERCSSKSWQGVSKPLQIPMVSFATSTNQTEWLHNVLVGEATSIHSLLDLQSLFRSFDVTDCTVKHLGGLRCMLDFENKQDASDFLLNRKDCWLNCKMLNGTKKRTAPHFVGHPLARENVMPLVHIYPTKSQKDKKGQRRENGTTTGVVSRSVSRAVLNGAGCYVWREREWHHHWSVSANQVAKGDVLSVAKIAGITGAKQTSNLIPLCHNIDLTHVRVDLRLNPHDYCVEIEGEAASTGKTGVEMEAMTAVTLAGLTVYDMCKAASKDIQITNVRLEHKTGGKSGNWSREK
nr:cyclic pyranopterin monophosphate synthase accessory protein, mitochondrial-like [Tanacetum cinerariifolium]